MFLHSEPPRAASQLLERPRLGPADKHCSNEQQDHPRVGRVENSSTVDCRIVAKSSGIAFDLLAASRLRLVGCSISSVSSKGSVVGELDCVHKGWRHQEHNCSLFPSQIVTNPLQIVSREPFYAASNFGYVRCILQIGDWFYMTTELRFRVYSSLQTTTVLDNNKEIFARRARRAVSNL